MLRTTENEPNWAASEKQHTLSVAHSHMHRKKGPESPWSLKIFNILPW